MMIEMMHTSTIRSGLLAVLVALAAGGFAGTVAPGAAWAQAQQQNPSGWTPGIAVTPPSQPQEGWTSENKPAAPPPNNPSDAVRRARQALIAAGAQPGIALSARLTVDGRRLSRGVVWRVFSDPADKKEKPEMLVQKKHPTPRIRLEPGTYLVNVAYGRSHFTKRVEILAGTMKAEEFVINAGGLRLTAYADEKKVPNKSVTFDIFDAETDQSGQRRLVMAKARPGVIIRLNAGIYFIKSTYGGANAQVETEVSVEAGKLTELAVAHAAAKVTLGLVTRPGGEALPATQWSISTPDGGLVARSVGALPTHILSPGTYRVIARNGGQEYQQDFEVQNNQMARVEVLVQ